MSSEYSTCGKWILAGEHSVLRGAPALVFPVKDYSMKFQFEKSETPLDIIFDGVKGDELRLIFWGLMEKALVEVKRTRNELKGRLKVISTLPLGAGLGASAALCVGVARFFSNMNWIDKADIYDFSIELENLFHGESSGVDIAVALEEKPLRFLRGGKRSPLKVNWKPQWFISYTGEKGVTSECVKKVQDLLAQDPKRGEALDDKMKLAADKCEKALAMDEKKGLKLLSEGITLAAECFKDWRLCDGSVGAHMDELLNAGALAVKPTGSGGGGYVLSLWKDHPDREDLISLN